MRYVIVLKTVISGPIIGGILTVLTFSTFGIHPRNIAPVFAGTIIANFFGVHNLSSTSAILSGLFPKLAWRRYPVTAAGFSAFPQARYIRPWSITSAFCKAD